MLNRLPQHTGQLADLLPDLGNPSATELARALGVSRRTVERWKRQSAPRTALLALWWLSREGHSAWDCEMANRTALALGLRDALWREITRLRTLAGLEGADTLSTVRRPRHAANDPTTRPPEASAGCA